MIDLNRLISNDRFYNRMAWFLILVGWVLRLRQYLANRSFWLDEAKFALKVQDLSYAELFYPAWNTVVASHIKLQLAPVGFFTISKLLTQWMGESEMVFRLFPLVCGLMSCILFLKVAKSYLPAAGALLALALFAVMENFIYHSSEFHPYGTDLFFALALYVLYGCMLRQPWNKRNLMMFSLIPAVILWFSNPSVFIAGGLGLSLIIQYAFAKDWSRFKMVLGVSAIWFLSFVLFYYVYTRYFLARYIWLEGGLLPQMPMAEYQWDWVVKSLRRIFVVNPLNLENWILGITLSTVGCCAFFVKQRAAFLSLVLPILLTVIAAVLRKYPFYGRLLLFLAPILIIFICNGVGVLFRQKNKMGMILGSLLIIFLFVQPATSALQHLTTPIYREEVRDLMLRVQEAKKPADRFYIYHGAQYTFEYYARRLQWEDNYILGEDQRNHPEYYPQELDSLRGHPRVWILLSHIRPGEQQIFLSYLNRIGRQRRVYDEPGAVAYLYDLSNL